jgi:hypothetical protein
MTIEAVDSFAADKVAREWALLDRRSGGEALMSSAVWVSTWLRHYGDLVPHRFFIGRCGGAVCGAALITEGVGRRIGPFGVKSVHLGTAGEPESDSVKVEYNRLLVDDDCRHDFPRAIFDTLLREARWDELRLDGFVPADVESLLAAGSPFHVDSETCRYFDLKSARDAGADVLSRFGRSTRSKIRHTLKAFPDLRGEWAETADEAADMFSDLVRLHQQRWNAVGKPGCYASRRFLNFHTDLLQQLVPQRRASLFRVSDGNDVIGCVQLFIDRNRILMYQSGFALQPGNLSPGLLVHALAIEECLRRGYDAYDFLAGDARYKQNLSTDSQSLVSLRLRRPRLKFAAAAVSKRVKQWLTRKPPDASWPQVALSLRDTDCAADPKSGATRPQTSAPGTESFQN